MQNRFFILICFLFLSFSLSAQKERKLIREGVKSFYDNDYPNSEISFRKALEIDSTSIPANYNVAASLYKQEKYDEARNILQKIAETNTDPAIQAGALHNIGNSYLKENKFQESIDAYKKSLMLQPNNMDTKYNLAYALQKLQQQQKQDKNKDKNKDKKDQNKDKQKQDQKNQDKQNQDQKNEDQKQDEQKKDEQDQQQQKNEDQNKDKKDQQQPQVKNLSPEEVKNMLEALEQQEKDVKEKVDKKKVKVVKSKTEKDW